MEYKPEKIRMPTPEDFGRLMYVHMLMRDAVQPIGTVSEALMAESLIRLVGAEEGWSDSDVAFITALSLGNATEDGWEYMAVPF